jgi:RES domain-containing protein
VYRLDRAEPAAWTGTVFPTPRFRFDPADGAFRTRYVASSPVTAARERYLDSGRYVPAAHGRHRLVTLQATRRVRVLDLRTVSVLDALGLDERISVSREPEVWAAAQRLAAVVRSWWEPPLEGLVYRSRCHAGAWNVALFDLGGFALSSVPFTSAHDVRAELVLDHHFTFEP